MRITEKSYTTNRDDWCAWLKENHVAKKEVWLVHYKRHTGKPSIPYDDAVEEALCFGWIDSIIKKVDEQKFVRRFTPRKGKSKWSEANKRRAGKMIKNGKMTSAGLERIREAKSNGEWFKTVPPRIELEIPPYVKTAFAANERALDNFNDLAKGYRRQLIGWIKSAKREETRKKRLAEAIRLLEHNEKLGMK